MTQPKLFSEANRGFSKLCPGSSRVRTSRCQEGARLQPSEAFAGNCVLGSRSPRKVQGVERQGGGGQAINQVPPVPIRALHNHSRWTVGQFREGPEEGKTCSCLFAPRHGSLPLFCGTDSHWLGLAISAGQANSAQNKRVFWRMLPTEMLTGTIEGCAHGHDG